MMLISSPFRGTALLSSRTAKYVEAMIREGDNFDYVSWLKKVREGGKETDEVRPAIKETMTLGGETALKFQILLISHNINKKIPFGSKNWTGRPTCHNQTCLIGRLVAGRG